MNRTEKYFWMYEDETKDSKANYSQDKKPEEKKFERIRKNIVENGLDSKLKDNNYTPHVAEPTNAPGIDEAPNNNYASNNAGSDVSPGVEANANNNGKKSTEQESLDELLRKLNSAQKPSSNNPTDKVPVDDILKAMPDYLKYQFGELWKQVRGTLFDGTDKELLEKTEACTGFILGNPKGVMDEVRNDVSGYFVYRGLQWLKQFKEKIWKG